MEKFDAAGENLLSIARHKSPKSKKTFLNVGLTNLLNNFHT